MEAHFDPEFEKELRYYIDLDLASNAICGWGYDLREKLVNVKLKAIQHRIFITKGQYNKLVQKASGIRKK
ncbi:MAG TPA: hypothetical protein PKY63_03075 [Bacteroidales bacterium]|nr:hypothetical protein [Bacteroidales bacterium]